MKTLIDYQLAEALAKGITLAGSSGQFQTLITAKYAAEPVPQKTLETELAAMQAVIADLEKTPSQPAPAAAVPATPAPVVIVPAKPEPVAAKTPAEHRAIFAAIVDANERGAYYLAHEADLLHR